MKENIFPIEKLFLIISLVFGIIFIFIIPPFNSPDEDSHFKKSYMMASGKIFPKEENKQVGHKVPVELLKYVSEKTTFMGDLDRKYSYQEMYLDTMLSTNYKEKAFVSYSTATTNPSAHFVPALGILVGKCFTSVGDGKSLSVSNLLYFGRVFSLIVYTMMAYFAIKITPKYKKTFFTILLIPMCLFLRSMVSYDGLLISSVALATARMLELIYNDKKSFKLFDYFIFIILGYVLLNVKTIYSLFFIMMFFIPKDRFKNGLKGKIKAFAIMILSVLILSFITRLFTMGFKVDPIDIVEKQKHFIFKHPFKTTKIIFSSIIHNYRIQAFWAIGTFGLLDTYLPPVIIYLIVFNLFIVTILEGLISSHDKIILKVLLFILIVLGIYGMYLKMYMEWTPMVTQIIGGKEVSGIQGRYFLPLCFGLPIIFSTGLLEKNKKANQIINNILSYYYIVPIISLSVSILVCLIRFWI